MCTLFSIFSLQPNKLRPILIFVLRYPIPHIFVPSCSIAWNRHCVYLQLPNFVALQQCIDTGLFWIQGYRTEKCTHCTLYSFWFSLCKYFRSTFCNGAPPPGSSFVVSVLDNLPEKVFTCCQRKNFKFEYYSPKIVFLDSSILNLFKRYHKPANTISVLSFFVRINPLLQDRTKKYRKVDILSHPSIALRLYDAPGPGCFA